MLEHDPLKRLAGTGKRHYETVRTVCRECTAGCGLLAYLQEGKIVDVQGDENDPFSRGRLCARGIAFHQGLEHPERIGGVMQRNSLSEPFQSGDEWEKVLDVLAERLRKIRARYGPRSLMIGCDPEAGLDFFIGAMRFARLWGTPDVFHPLYATRGISAPMKDPGPSAPRCADWGKSKCILLVEADLATTHPVAFGRLMDARDRGTEIIALDSRFTPTMSKADASFELRPESGNRFALALMKAMIEENLYSTDLAASFFNHFESWKASFETVDYGDLEKMTGLPAGKVKEIARRLAAKTPVTVITGKRLSHRQNSGIWPTIVSAAGWGNMEGGGWYPLDAGVPPFMPFADIDKVDSRGKTAEGPEGGDIDEMAEFSEDPENPVKALISSGNCLHDFMSCLRSTARGTELNIHFGAFPNETLSLAHFVIPATLRPEREALSFSNDRAIRWANRIVEPAQGMRSGLDLWTGLAQRLGDVRRLEWKTYFPWKKEDGSADIRSFYGWFLDQSPYTKGAAVDRIIAEDNAPLFWPVERTQSDSHGKIDPFFAPADLQSVSQAGELFPLTYQATRIVSRSGDIDNFRPLTKDLEDRNTVQIHPRTAKALGIENGDEVSVHGPGETIEAAAWITRMVPVWMIWSPRRLGSDCAVICKKGQSREEASLILKELLQ